MPICPRATANLHECPKPITVDYDYTHISIGDLHGNALKLIYTLIEEGVLELDEARYNILRDIYLKPVTQLMASDIRLFEAIIDKVTVNPTKSITLIGDELADRGNNDYFTLLVLQKLKESRCNVNIILSNHSMEFIAASAMYDFSGTVDVRPNSSLKGMQHILNRGFILDSTVRKIIDDVYTPMVKAIDYTISKDGQITLFSHAPIGLETVEALAKKFEIQYKEATPLELIHTIDAINDAINKTMKDKSDTGLVALFKKEIQALAKTFANNLKIMSIPTDCPLYRNTWQRKYDFQKTTTASGIQVDFVHGHIGPEPLDTHGHAVGRYRNLDNNFGKFPSCFKDGVYTLNDQQVFVQHFTCHSSDILAHQLNDYMNAHPEFESIMTDSKKAVAMQTYRELLLRYKDAILQMEKISQDLQEKAKTNASYKAVAATVATNVAALKTTGESFFSQPITAESIATFQNATTASCQILEAECKKHRGWHSIDAGTRKKLGACLIVLSIISCGLFAIPALIIHCATKGFGHTFFETPETNTATAFHKIKAELENTVMRNLQTAQDMKAEVSALKPTENHEPNSDPDTISPETSKP